VFAFTGFISAESTALDNTMAASPRKGGSPGHSRAEVQFRDLAMARADGSLLARLRRIDVLVIDDRAIHL
jgi:hypothetical protein